MPRSRTATPGGRLRGRVELREALGAEVLVHFTIAARQAVTEDMRELAEDVGDDRVVEQLAGRTAPGGDDRRAVQPADEARRRATTSTSGSICSALHFFDLETGAPRSAYARPWTQRPMHGSVLADRSILQAFSLSSTRGPARSARE